MLNINKRIEIRTYNIEHELILDCMYLVQQHFTFNLSVKSGYFSGSSHFCISINQIKEFAQTLHNMFSCLSGSTQLFDNDSDSFLDFSIDKYGHVAVSGQVGGSQEDHYMRFQFVTDQTVLPEFIKELKEISQMKE